MPWDALETAIASAPRNPSNRRECSYYFDDASREVVAAADGELMRKFGYSCCGGKFVERPWEDIPRGEL